MSRSRSRPAVAATSDYEYERNGTANLFMVCEPLAGQAAGQGDRAAHRRSTARTRCKELVDVHYPEAETHRAGAWTTSTPTRRPRCTRRSRPPRPGGWPTKLEIHYTPKHGSWLNMAEIELSVLEPPVPRPPHPGPRRRSTPEVAAWESTATPPAMHHRLALHHRRRPHQAQTTLPRHRTCQLCCGGPLVD